MSNDHWRYRDGYGGWEPFWADIEAHGGSCATTLPIEQISRKQPIGFRGANPGQSLNDRGLPRIRIKARRDKEAG